MSHLGYLNIIKTKFNCSERNYDGGVIESDGGLTIFCEPGKSLKGSSPDKLDSHNLEEAHFYILKNCDEIQPFLEEFSQIHSEASQQSSDVEWNRQFISWLQKKVEMNPSKTLKYEMGQASKIPKHGLIQPGALAKELGQSLKVMSTTRVNAEQRTSISKNRSYNATTSKLNKLADNTFHVHPCFDEKEDNDPFRQGAEMNQYTLTSGARARGQSLGINVEKSTLIDKNRSTTTTSSRNKPAKTSICAS
ncbi:hypothetical protein KY284_007944 [Solanum tuberosum]|nr:hypothetical protein KY284_007944 [Solanum tuberosum]